MTSAVALSALGVAVNRITAAAGLARAVADHVPNYDEGGKLDCLDAIELHLLPARCVGPAGSLREGARGDRKGAA
jgi:hypothetical protein